MSDILALQQALPITAFGPTSRYAALEIAKIDLAGETHLYVRRRFLPQPESLAVLGEHTVSQLERLDHIAARYFGDPELFWRIVDANRTLRPEELTETPGRRLAITLPEGVPGIPNA
ncbi:MAG: LysM domain-containing protein [Thermoanaerobaculia bacterium]